jgi:glutamate dehydrogenase (NADP+)
MQAFSRIIGPDRDIPAPDVYTNAMIMGWIADEYSSIVGQATPAVVTGKPIALGGSLGRDDATARGGYYLVNHLASELRLPKQARIAIQGFGNAGSHIARLFAADGHRIVAVSDSHGAIARPTGLDLSRVAAAKAETGSVVALAQADGVEQISPDELVDFDCDVLVPSALEDMIHAGNAGQVKAKVILELANGPITPEADEILNRKGVVVLPDILANAGGVTVSYFEWVQNKQCYSWPLEDIHARLASMIEKEGREIWNRSLELKTSLRTAAYVHALARLAEAIEAHGTQQYFAS